MRLKTCLARRLEGCLKVFDPGFIGREQRELPVKNGIVVQVGKRDIMEIEILSGRDLIIQIEFALAEIGEPIGEMITLTVVVDQVDLQGFHDVVVKFIVIEDGQEGQPNAFRQLGEPFLFSGCGFSGGS